MGDRSPKDKQKKQKQHLKEANQKQQHRQDNAAKSHRSAEQPAEQVNTQQDQYKRAG